MVPVTGIALISCASPQIVGNDKPALDRMIGFDAYMVARCVGAPRQGPRLTAIKTCVPNDSLLERWAHTTDVTLRDRSCFPA
jgi:hypothetical protein